MAKEKKKSKGKKSKGKSKEPRWMPTCDVCDEEVGKVYKCKTCGTEFCDSCGSASQMLCEYCQEEDKE